MSDICYIKMSNGEDVVSTVLEEDEECYYVTYPLKFVYTKNSTSESIIMGMIPWVPTEELMNSIFQIHKFNIITILPSPEKLKVHYESQMGLSKENMATKIRDLYEKINESPELFKLWTSNTSNNWIN